MFHTHAPRRTLGIAVILLGTLAVTAPAFAAPGAGTPSASSVAARDKGGAGQGASVAVAPNTAGPQITRSQVLARAQTWVGIGLDYNQGSTYQGYRTDCSGYASMAWHLGTPGLDTTSFVPSGVASWIGKNDLKPGDALLNDSAGNSGHIAIFGGWTDSSHTSYDGYEFTGSGVHHRTIPYPYFSGYGTFKPVRNNSVVDDVVDPGPDNVGIYRPSEHTFYLRMDDGSTKTIGWGTVGDLPVAGDWDGGPDNVGIYRPSEHTFYLRMDDGSTKKIGWGTTGDLPVSANWDGGTADNVGIYRPSEHTFYLRMDDGSTKTIGWGTVGDLPVAGNWDGGSAGNVGIYRPSEHTFYLRMDDGSTKTVGWGTTGDLPVSADWDDAGPDNVGIYRQSDHTFYLRMDDGSTKTVGWGTVGDLPVTANWDARS
ncbi:hypothetical protein [Streptomyces sp. NBC_01198]|uniref:hypothetical protein n=1 Tax=Streptomyces sp. NBC_01198 TaxID=2903769 RepID=UPI002E12C548|nr:hypothetical protein OG702_04385 [Streptomyces sp. NBC_01198]